MRKTKGEWGYAAQKMLEQVTATYGGLSKENQTRVAAVAAGSGVAIIGIGLWHLFRPRPNPRLMASIRHQPPQRETSSGGETSSSDGTKCSQSLKKQKPPPVASESDPATHTVVRVPKPNPVVRHPSVAVNSAASNHLQCLLFAAGGRSGVDANMETHQQMLQRQREQQQGQLAELLTRTMTSPQ